MPIRIEDIEPDLTIVTLSGRIDLAGAQEIDMPMSVVGGSRRAVIVEMSGVEFMASLGLRTLVMAAKTIQRRNGRIVLLAPTPDVEEVVRTTGVDELIPICRDEAEARAAVRPG